MNNYKTELPDRRQFLKILSAGSLFCLGCTHLAAIQEDEKKTTPSIHKFQQDSKMTFSQVFMSTYQNQVELLRALSDRIGKEKFMKMLKDAVSEAAAKSIKMYAASVPKNDLATFAIPLKTPDHFWKHALTTKIIIDAPRELKINVTECLWASTLKKLKATDIGYAISCHPDFAMAPAFNPKLKMLRTKTLMQGHEYCDHHWIMEA